MVLPGRARPAGDIHLAVDHLLPDEFLKELAKQFPPGLTDALTGGEEVHHHTVQPGQQTILTVTLHPPHHPD